MVNARQWARVLVVNLIGVASWHGLSSAQNLTNWIRPDGFYSPDIRAGQYAFQAGVALQGNSALEKPRFSDESPLLYQSIHSTQNEWELRTRLTYGLTDRWVILANLSWRPGQLSDDMSYQYSNGVDRRIRRIDHALNASFTLAYRPWRAIELFGVGSYDRSLSASGTASSRIAFKDGHTDFLTEGYELFVGFNVAR